jgi:Ca2+-dependent lipid-binding protein
MQSTLRVGLIRGESLPAADANGLSDPYAVIRLDGGSKKKSEVIYKTLDPDWSQDFIFDEDINNVGRQLLVEVWDRDMMSSDFLGKGLVDVSNLEVGVKKEVTVELEHPSKSGSRGKVYLTVMRTRDEKQAADNQEKENQAKSTGGLGISSMMKAVGGQMSRAISKATHPNGGKGVKRMITIDVIKARGIPPMDYNGFADPYCRVKVGRKRRTTRTQFRTLAPEWRERFVFILFDMGGRDSNVCRVDIWDKDTIGSDDKVAHVDIDLSGLTLNLTDERWWKMKKYDTKSIFGWKSVAKDEDGEPLPDPEVLLLITVADLFEPQLPKDKLLEAQKLAQGWLRVHILKADNLPAMDSNGLCDGFVVVEVGNRHSRTHTVEKELNPEWNTILEMPVKDVFECAYIHVYDEDANGKFEKVGSLCIPLLSMKNGVANWYQLKDESLQHPVQGCIKLAFHLNYLQVPMLAKCISRRTP